MMANSLFQEDEGAGVEFQSNNAYSDDFLIFDSSNHTSALLWQSDQDTLNATLHLEQMDNSSDYGFTDQDILDACMHLARYKNFRLVMDVFVVGFLITAGMLGNTLTILVMRADNMNSSVSFLLQALAVADNTYLLACLFMQTFKALAECSNWIPSLKYSYHYMEPYIWPLASTAQTITVWLVVLVTLDRYIAICYPLNTSRIFTLKKIKCAVLFIILLGIVYNIPRFFEHQTVEKLELCLNETVLRSVHTNLRKNRQYFIIYKTCFYFLFRVVIPLSMLAILNTKLIMALKGATKSHAVLTRTTPRSDSSFTQILVVVVTVFMLCEVPSFILRLVVTVKHFAGTSTNFDYQHMVWYSSTMCNLLLTLNSSVNCLIYCVSGNRFRKILKRLCCRMCMSNSSNQSSLVMGDDPFLTNNHSVAANGHYNFLRSQSTMKSSIRSSLRSSHGRKSINHDLELTVACMKDNANSSEANM